MNLKTLCMNNLIELIKNLPPLLKEEVISQSVEQIKTEERLKIMKEINRSASIVIEDVTENIINSSKTGIDWIRPEYTKDIDNDLYQTFVNISQNFVDKHIDIFQINKKRSRQYFDSDSSSDEDMY